MDKYTEAHVVWARRTVPKAILLTIMLNCSEKTWKKYIKVMIPHKSCSDIKNLAKKK